MAFNSTNIATIAGQLERVMAAETVITNKVVDWELIVPAGSYWDGSAITAISKDTKALATHKLDAIAAALNAIQKRTSLSTKADGSLYLEEGYYPQLDLSGMLSDAGNATANDIVDVNNYQLDNTKAKTTAVVGGKVVTGALKNNSGASIAAPTANEGTYKKSGDTTTDYLKIKIPETAKYNENSYITTNIKYNNLAGITGNAGNVGNSAWNPTVEITKTTNAETNESSLTINSLTIPAGYYTQNIVIKPILSTSDAGEKIINTTTFEPGNTVKAGTHSVPTGYDYFTSVVLRHLTAFTLGTDLTAAESGWVDKNDTILEANATQENAKKEGNATTKGSAGVHTNLSIGKYEIYNDTKGNKKPYLSLTPTKGYYNGTAWETNKAYYDSSVTGAVLVLNPTGTTTVTVSGEYTIPEGYYDGTYKISISGSLALGAATFNATSSYNSTSTKHDFVFSSVAAGYAAANTTLKTVSVNTEANSRTAAYQFDPIGKSTDYEIAGGTYVENKITVKAMPYQLVTYATVKDQSWDGTTVTSASATSPAAEKTIANSNVKIDLSDLLSLLQSI